MWESYRKRFVFMQLVILAVCAVARFYFKESWPMVAICFGVMQLFSLLGAWWGSRLQERLRNSDDELPLNRKD